MSTIGAGYLTAFGGGVASFASPCVLPLVPAYLSVVTGLDIADIRAGSRRHLGRIGRDTLLFVAGFGAVFVLLGLGASALGQALLREKLILTRVSGVLVMMMGLFLAGSLVLRLPALYGEARLGLSASRLGPVAAPVAGVAFGFGWTPCIGPVLTSVLLVAASRANMVQGTLLLSAYAAGMGVPFLVTGLAMSRLATTFSWVRGHFRVITAGSALLIIFFGALLTADRLSWVTAWISSSLRDVGLGRLVGLG